MKKFFEEYGFVILVAIVVIILIAMVSPIGGLIKTQISDIATSFGKKTDIKLRAVSDGNNTANLRYDSDGKIQLDFSSKNSTDTFTAYANYISEGKEIEDEPLTNIVNHPAGTAAISLASIADIGKYLQIKLINDGTQEIFYSNGLAIQNNTKSAKNDENSEIVLDVGSTIILEEKEYLILKKSNNNQYLLMAKENITKMNQQNYHPELKETYKKEYENGIFENSNIDKYLNGEFYNSLSQKTKDAIIERTVKQQLCELSSNLICESYESVHHLYTSEIQRKILLPSISEINDLLEKTFETSLNDYWIFEGFTSKEESSDSYGIVAFPLWGGEYSYSVSWYNAEAGIRPTFVIDLSKVDFTLKEN